MACGPHQTFVPAPAVSGCIIAAHIITLQSGCETRCFSIHTPNHRNIYTWWPLQRPAELTHFSSYKNYISLKNHSLQYEGGWRCFLWAAAADETSWRRLWCSKDLRFHAAVHSGSTASSLKRRCVTLLLLSCTELKSGHFMQIKPKASVNY